MTYLLKKFAATSAVALVMLVAATDKAPAQSANDNATQVQPEGKVKYYKVQLKHDVPVDKTKKGPSHASAPAGAHLTYFGGRVVGSAQVIEVLWGSGAYDTHVLNTNTPSMATFYEQLLSSSYTNWLDSEYNTVNPSGTKTNQHIVNGAFVQQVTITPSAGANGATIDDSVIQSELRAQINAGHIPPPQTDAQGNTTTIYAVFFPPGKTITQGGSSSCVSGGFCAYHGTIAATAPLPEIYYGVHPDMQSGSGCFTGCGNSSVFGNYTSVASHELVETITDAEVGIATVVGPPLAWYDTTNGEIGDICNAQQGTFVGADNQTYTIQLEFSNAQNNCIIPSITYTNDFSISASPSTLTLGRNSSGNSTISTAVTAGVAGTVNLSVSGLPSGAGATFSPASVTAGSSSTLTVTSGSAAAGTYTLTVTGTESGKTHSTTVTLTITTAVTNDFSISASPASLSLAPGSNGTSTISTAVAAGIAGTVSLTASGAPSGVTISLNPTSVTAGSSSTLTVSTSAGAAAGTYTLTVTGTEGTRVHSTSVSLTISGASGGGIVNGGFESGLTGWTSSGAAVSVATSGCHGGTSCARVGSTAPTNGDSSVAQTFTAPSNATGISFWYKIVCPDTLTYDWAVATLKDNTTGTTANPLVKTCTNSGAWVNATASLTAGHSYTLTLTSHDDNYAGDPTYTLYDDVNTTTGGGGGGLTNGGFETGSFSGWTTSGASDTIVSSGCHSGTYCARAGTTTPTNGDSSITQTFTVPAGKSLLSLYYKMTCPDTVVYDWATVTLKNNSTGTTATMLAKTCTTNPWTNVSTAVTAGTSYTLTLTSHDDNYSADPSFTLYDDVVLQ